MRRKLAAVLCTLLCLTAFTGCSADEVGYLQMSVDMLKGMEEGRKEIEAIVNNPEEPSFENTIVALDRQGELLRKVQIVFGGQNSVNTNDDMQNLSREMSPLLSQYRDDTFLAFLLRTSEVIVRLQR